ncbi:MULTISPECIES: hypothetical protein [unclassified Rhizobium]|uniref:hypothetical protein n=1 Tax=unclassified Rhizobium TaxID=2613769 RepID=UPI001C830EB7|nr:MULTISPECIES: hypothetical protein [unclassified Rhizobium]MBX5167010.1 hypothetical protein [Rhizobium sp. NZLR4b]MBX5211157.1 hypothetical protein [Rhizobium sp. NZLR11]
MKTHFTEDLGRLKRLVADLEEAGLITAPAIMASPVLDRWMPNFRVVSCIEGTVEGHPAHPNRARVKTSQLFALSQAEGESFARTFNQWYRLGSERVR